MKQLAKFTEEALTIYYSWISKTLQGLSKSWAWNFHVPFNTLTYTIFSRSINQVNEGDKWLRKKYSITRMLLIYSDAG